MISKYNPNFPRFNILRGSQFRLEKRRDTRIFRVRLPAFVVTFSIAMTSSLRPLCGLALAATTLFLAACASQAPTAPIPSKHDQRVVHLPTPTETPRDWEVWLTITNKWWGGQSNTWLVPKTLGILTFSGGWYDPKNVNSRGNIQFWTGEPGIIFPPLWLIGALAVVPKLSCEASLVLPPEAASEYWVSIEWRGPNNSAQLRARPDRGSGVYGSTIVVPCLHKGDLVYRPGTPLHNELPSPE